jgi:hypothetical protein
VAGEPFWRISRQDLDKLMTTLDVTFVRLSECALAAAAHLAVPHTNASTIHCCLVILLDDETPIHLTPHTGRPTLRRSSVECRRRGVRCLIVGWDAHLGGNDNGTR